jgi:hypothetical protein
VRRAKVQERRQHETLYVISEKQSKGSEILVLFIGRNCKKVSNE